jgi:hypothetical protein
MKKVYIVVEEMEGGLYDMNNIRVFEKELDAVLAAELGDYNILVFDVVADTGLFKDRK